MYTRRQILIDEVLENNVRKGFTIIGTTQSNSGNTLSQAQTTEKAETLEELCKLVEDYLK